MSVRKEFGSVPIPAFIECWSPMEGFWRVIYNVLTNLSGAEETAIQQIAPLISIVSLRNSNIISRDNTSCVSQKSKLSTILPNLPSEYQFIVIRRHQQSRTNNNNYSLKETTFNCDQIEGILRMLKYTCESWTDVTISDKRLSQWPQHGDLVDLNN